MLNCTQSLEQFVLWPLLSESERDALKQTLCQCTDCQLALVQAIASTHLLETQRGRYQTLRYARPIPSVLAQAVRPQQKQIRWWSSALPVFALAACLLIVVLAGNVLLPDRSLKPKHLLSGPTITWTNKSATKRFERGNWRLARGSTKRPATYRIYRHLFTRRSDT